MTDGSKASCGWSIGCPVNFVNLEAFASWLFVLKHTSKFEVAFIFLWFETVYMCACECYIYGGIWESLGHFAHSHLSLCMVRWSDLLF